tara:strand:+ start:846 stop:1079 length:234 start_codon:yes stop_codon:yes gene_type:complete
MGIKFGPDTHKYLLAVTSAIGGGKSATTKLIETAARIQAMKAGEKKKNGEKKKKKKKKSIYNGLGPNGTNVDNYSDY